MDNPPQEQPKFDYEMLMQFYQEEIAWIYRIHSNVFDKNLIRPEDPDPQVVAGKMQPLSAVVDDFEFISGIITSLRREGWDALHQAYFMAAFGAEDIFSSLLGAEKACQKYSPEEIERYEQRWHELWQRCTDLETQFGYIPSFEGVDSREEFNQVASTNWQLMKRLAEEHPEIKAALQEWGHYDNQNHELGLASLYPQHLKHFESANWHMARIRDYLAGETRIGFEKAAKLTAELKRFFATLGSPLFTQIRAEAGF